MKKQEMNIINLNTVNLNINDYNIKDLEKIFGLSEDKKYKKSDIELKEAAIYEKLINDKNINNQIRNEIILFYKEAKKKLINETILPNLPPTTFQYDGREQLDKSNNIWLPHTLGSYSGGTEYGRPGSTLDIFNQESSRRDKNEVVQHIDKPFINTNTSNIYTGVINPLNTRFINKYLTIDSRFRETPYTSSLINSSSDFTIQLPDKIQRVISMQLSSLEIPITYYANSSYIGNNYMYITITDTSNNITQGLVTIPDGTYTPTSIATSINNILTTLGGLFTTITINYNNVNGRFTIETTSTSILSFKIDFTTTSSGNPIIYNNCDNSNLNNCNPIPTNNTITYNIKNPLNVDLTRRLGYTLGFLSGVYNNLKTYTGESVANTIGMRYMFLAVDDFNMNVANNQFITNAKLNIIGKNILARITIGNGGFLSILNENDFKIITEPRKYFGPVDITRLKVQLYDDYGTIIDMNGSDFSFSLNLEIVYDL